MRPCDQLATCSGCHSACTILQLGEAPADLCDPELGAKWILFMDNWMFIFVVDFFCFCLCVAYEEEECVRVENLA